jgi:hypothetical protein
MDEISGAGAPAASPGPDRGAPGQEGVDAFGSVGREHIVRHHLGRIGVGRFQIQLGLTVEGLLADGECERALSGDLSGEGVDLLIQRRLRDHAIYQPDLACAGGTDQLTRQQHLHRRLASDSAGERDHRRGAEQADVDPRSGETRRLGRHREITGRDELAAGGGSDAVDAGYRRLGQADDTLH